MSTVLSSSAQKKGRTCELTMEATWCKKLTIFNTTVVKNFSNSISGGSCVPGRLLNNEWKQVLNLPNLYKNGYKLWGLFISQRHLQAQQISMNFIFDTTRNDFILYIFVFFRSKLFKLLYFVTFRVINEFKNSILYCQGKIQGKQLLTFPQMYFFI